MLTSFFVTIILPFAYFYSEARAIYALELFTLSFMGLTLVFSVQRHGRVLTAPNKALLALLLAWAFTLVRSYFTAITPDFTYPNLLKAGALLLLVGTTARELSESPQKTKLSFFAFGTLAGAIHGLLALLEYIEAPPIPATWLDPAAVEIFRTRCAGIFTDPNIFGSFLSILFMLTLGYIVTASSKGLRLLGLASALLSGFGILSTLSRGAWVALAAALLVASLALYFKPQPVVSAYSKKLLWVLTLCLALVVLIGPFKYRLISIGKPTDMTFAQRTFINKAFAKHYQEFPLTGYGLHSFNQVYPRFRLVGGDYPMNAHNEFLHSLLETGHLSALLLAFTALYLLKIFFSIREKASVGSVVFPSIFVMLLVQNLSGFSSRILPTAAFIAVSVGYAFYAKLGAKKKPKQGFFLARAAALILMCYLTFVCTNAFATQIAIEKAGALLKTGNILESKARFEAIFKRNPKNTFVLSVLANISARLGNRYEAMRLYADALDLNPTEASFFEALGQLATDDGLEESVNFYEYAVKLDPASENYRLALAKLYLRIKEVDKAKEVLKVGLTYSPGFHEVYKGFYEMETILDLINK
jgi:O-antigen ligase